LLLLAALADATVTDSTKQSTSKTAKAFFILSNFLFIINYTPDLFIERKSGLHTSEA